MRNGEKRRQGAAKQRHSPHLPGLCRQQPEPQEQPADNSPAGGGLETRRQLQHPAEAGRPSAALHQVATCRQHTNALESAGTCMETVTAVTAIHCRAAPDGPRHKLQPNGLQPYARITCWRCARCLRQHAVSHSESHVQHIGQQLRRLRSQVLAENGQ